MLVNRVVVIGSNSFSGACFVDYLLNKGHEVYGLSRSDEPLDSFLPYKSNKNLGNFTFCRFDLNKDSQAIQSLLSDLKPSYVVNFAAQSMVAQSWERPLDWFQTNVMSNIVLHEYLRKCDYLEKYIHISTPEVYGSTSGEINEDERFNPSTPYAVSRAACDMSLMSYYKAYNFPVIFTRAANVYGPGQQLYRIIPKTILSIEKGEKLPLHGGGVSTRSFIHMNDVADGTYRLFTKGKPGEVYHFSTQDQISIKDLVSLICKKMDVDFNEAVEVVGERLGKDSAYTLGSQKARVELGWSDSITLENGVAQTIQWFKENKNELLNQPDKYIHKP